jgi:hypothetical protein
MAGSGRATAWLNNAPAQKLPKVLRVAPLVMLALLAAPSVSEGQQSKTIPRLCLLTFEPYTLGKRPGLDAFLQTLRDLGHIDGRSTIIDYLSADERGERFPALAAECLRLKADVIATSTTPAAQAAKHATRTIPIVMIAQGDPVGTGLVNGLAQPGGNITGTSQMIPALAAKRLHFAQGSRTRNLAGYSCCRTSSIPLRRCR